jgi:hypothetical protein
VLADAVAAAAVAADAAVNAAAATSAAAAAAASTSLPSPGGAVQVYSIKPTLTAPGNERSKLKCDEPLSNFAFNFNLRRYTPAPPPSSNGIV